MPTTTATSLTPLGAGFTFSDSAPDSYGVTWDWTGDAVRSHGAQIRESTGDNANRDGQWDATQFLGSQTFPVSANVQAPTHELLRDAERRLRALLVPVQYTSWTIAEPGWSGTFNGRRQGDLLWTEVGNADALGRPTLAIASFTLYCPDSYISATTPTLFTLAFGGGGSMNWQDSPGLDWSASLDWRETGGSNSAVLSNPGPGAAPVPLLLTFTGPITSASITVQQGAVSQQRNFFNGDVPGADLLAAGQTLTVDTGAHSVLLNGTGSRRYWSSGGAWPLVPAGDSTIYLTGVGTGSVSGSYSPGRY